MPIRQTVLIVEGDLATRLLYERALQQDYQVLAASSEQEVSALLNTNTALDAVVLEPGPLGTWGWTLPAQLRKHAGFQSAPLILCTAQDERRRGLELGAIEYLLKPVSPAALLQAVRRHARPAALVGEPS